MQEMLIYGVSFDLVGKQPIVLLKTADGNKYKKGPFRVVVHDPGNYTDLEVWYREDHRRFHHPLYVHELQNHHLAMTKVPLEATVAR